MGQVGESLGQGWGAGRRLGAEGPWPLRQPGSSPAPWSVFGPWRKIVWKSVMEFPAQWGETYSQQCTRVLVSASPVLVIFCFLAPQPSPLPGLNCPFNTFYK